MNEDYIELYISIYELSRYRAPIPAILTDCSQYAQYAACDANCKLRYVSIGLLGRVLVFITPVKTKGF